LPALGPELLLPALGPGASPRRRRRSCCRARARSSFGRRAAKNRRPRAPTRAPLALHRPSGRHRARPRTAQSPRPEATALQTLLPAVAIWIWMRRGWGGGEGVTIFFLILGEGVTGAGWPSWAERGQLGWVGWMLV